MGGCAGAGAGGEICHEVGFAHGVERNATGAGDGTRAVSTWGGLRHCGGMVLGAVGVFWGGMPQLRETARVPSPHSGFGTWRLWAASRRAGAGAKKRGPPADVSVGGPRQVAATYSPTLVRSTIGAGGLNFSVRDGKRWGPAAIAA